MLFLTQIHFGLFCAIAANRILEEIMSPEEIQNFFGIRDGKIPDYKLGKIELPNRFKRSDDNNLSISLKYLPYFNVTVNMTRVDDSYLIGENTEIFFAETDSTNNNSVIYTSQPSILKNLGNFTFYQDLETNSAVTLFSFPNGSEYLSGIIMEEFAIKQVDYRLANKLLNNSFWIYNHAFKLRSVDSNSDENDYSDENISQKALYVIYKIPKIVRKSLHHAIFKSEFDDKRIKKRAKVPIPTAVYPKILVSMDFQSTQDDVSKDLRYLISYFNAVDQVYRHLDNPKVRLCITGIIIPKDSKATPYIAQDTKNISDVSAITTIYSAIDYFDSQKTIFPPDSYNIFILLTMKSICLNETGDLCYEDSGISKYNDLCINSQNQSVMAIVISRYDLSYGIISTVAHELAHTLGAIDHDGEDTYVSCPSYFGYIMSPADSKNLFWSSCSAQSIATYLEHSNRSCMHQPPVSKLN